MNKKVTPWFSPHDQKRRIGSLTEVSATEAKVNLSKAGVGEQILYLGNRISVGEVNEFVFIDCGKDSILARVVKVWLENADRLSVDALDDKVPENNPIGLLQLLVSVDTVSGYNYRGIRQYPRIGAQVYAAHPRLVSQLAEGRANLNSGDIDMRIAEMPNDTSVAINITPEKLFSRHCAILGTTGGGKSYTMANLIENAFSCGGKILLLDATGEYKALPCTTYYVGQNPNAKQGEQITYPHYKFTESDLRALLRPSAQSQAPKLEAAIQSLRLVTQYHTVNGYGGLSITPRFTLEKALKQKHHFELCVQAVSTFEHSIPWSFCMLSEQIVEECVWPNGGTANNPNPLVWGGRADNDVGHCLNLISRIKAFSANPHLKWMIDCDHNLKSIPEVLEQFSKSNVPEVLRLDVSAVPYESHAREILVNAIGRKLLSCARDGFISPQNPLLVFIDEAHQFLNKRIGDEATKFELDAFGNIAKEGRKFGLNTVIATQRPRDIPEDVLSQIGTLIVHRLTNNLDQEIVKKAVGSIDQRSASFLPVLGQGEALLLGIDFPFPMTVKIKSPNARPASRSAPFSASWTANKAASTANVTPA